ncbi:phage integrase SAM-like domain-containing protein [Empedobacter falsenii]|uniref:phage integrase SAM-like domain-containing protein n=1 Tax=Empedobacter falsenii TaxID=343874 RepID=UPI00257891F6|nr:phage integrase SAM-like domain-containing protein [Empedobacter falsenii]MDM1298188.1 phage integrase SAM-like domain-containing protein [Empedobacter falsenii]MDM1317737.1 phage integrase SAM-like domain-containing protein [Empedobacter falsenii]
MITAEIILDLRRKTKKGFPVKIRVYDSVIKKHDYVSLKIYQNEESLKSDNLIKQREFELIKELEFVNSRNMSLAESLTIFHNGVPLNDIEKRILELEAELSRLRSQLKPTMLFDFSERYIQEKINRKELVRIHRSVLLKFKSFISPKENIAINDLKIELLLDFQNYLSENMSEESVNTYFSKFQSIFLAAQNREDLNIKQQNPFKFIKKVNVNKDIDKSISLDSLKKLKNYNFENWKWIDKTKYKMIVDLFLFQIAIGGHDFIDITELKWTNIKNDRISFKRNKNRKLNNGGPLINNKLFPFALEVIEKYGTKENERVFSFIPRPDYESDNSEYKIHQAGYNRILTAIKNKAEIKEEVISKRARYTFNTIAGNLLINRDMIEEIQGHTQSSISHGYYGGTLNEIKDAEHLKVIEAVFG